MSKQHKILVANRGEIAIRIMQACRKLGHDFAAVYTDSDSGSGHVAYAREHSGDAPCRISSYHDANELLCVADHVGATAIHPGYGFFAEDYRFARRVTERDRRLVFIGPSWRVIRELGDKINTKRLARELGVPTVPGSDRPIYDEVEAEKLAASLFDLQIQQGVSRPLVLVKASAGGGGMGIEEVYDIDMFRSVYRKIRNYAMRQFKDDGVLIEQRIKNFNHVEVQIVSDRTGRNPVHFGTRNCSIQSPSLQKRLEVAPGFLPGEVDYGFDAAAVLGEIIAHSVTIARKVGYDNVGTWEWIVTENGEPFLMEVNARIQVENGVSAAISRVRGEQVDLLAEQIRLALGSPLGYSQSDVTFEGCALEYRIIAEDTANGFMPWIGAIDELSWKAAPGLKVHTHVAASDGKPYVIPTEFDPNLALAVLSAGSAGELKQAGLSFLDSLRLRGHAADGSEMKSNIGFLREKTGHIFQFEARH